MVGCKIPALLAKFILCFARRSEDLLLHIVAESANLQFIFGF